MPASLDDTNNFHEGFNMSIPFSFNDGGRSDAGFKGHCGDCGVRAAAIAVDAPYIEVYRYAQELNKSVKLPKCKRITQSSSVRDGVHVEVMHALLKWYGFTWVPTMKIGSGCKTHLHAGELPPGRIVCRVSKHYCAVIDGVLHDTHDCSRYGTRCVYGYWT